MACFLAFIGDFASGSICFELRSHSHDFASCICSEKTAEICFNPVDSSRLLSEQPVINNGSLLGALDDLLPHFRHSMSRLTLLGSAFVYLCSIFLFVDSGRSHFTEIYQRRRIEDWHQLSFSICSFDEDLALIDSLNRRIHHAHQNYKVFATECSPVHSHTFFLSSIKVK